LLVLVGRVFFELLWIKEPSNLLLNIFVKPAPLLCIIRGRELPEDLSHFFPQNWVFISQGIDVDGVEVDEINDQSHKLVLIYSKPD